MEYTKPTILNSFIATAKVQQSTNKGPEDKIDGAAPFDLNATKAAYEADE